MYNFNTIYKNLFFLVFRALPVMDWNSPENWAPIPPWLNAHSSPGGSVGAKLILPPTSNQSGTSKHLLGAKPMS